MWLKDRLCGWEETCLHGTISDCCPVSNSLEIRILQNYFPSGSWEHFLSKLTKYIYFTTVKFITKKKRFLLSREKMGAFYCKKQHLMYFHILCLNFHFYQIDPQISLTCGFPGGSDGKDSACNTGNPGSIPRLRRSSGEGNGNPLWYSCLENPVDGGAWQSRAREVSKSWTRLSDFTDVQYVCERGFCKESVFALGKRRNINIWTV